MSRAERTRRSFSPKKWRSAAGIPPSWLVFVGALQLAGCGEAEPHAHRPPAPRSSLSLPLSTLSVSSEFGFNPAQTLSSSGEERPRVAFNGQYWLISYRGGGPLLRVDAAGTTTAIDRRLPDDALTSNGNTFLGAGEAQFGSGMTFARLSAAGELLDATPVPLAPAAFSTTAATARGSEYLVAWAHTGLPVIHLARIDAAGSVQQSSTVPLTAPPTEVAVASDGTGYLLAWHDIRFDEALQGNSYVMRLTGSLAAVDAAPVIVGSGPSGIAVASTGNGYLFVRSSAQLETYAIPASGSIAELSPTFTEVATGVPSMAAVGSSYLISASYVDDGNLNHLGPAQVRAFDSTGAPVATSWTEVCNLCADAVLAGGTTKGLVAWAQYFHDGNFLNPQRPSEVYAAGVDSVGTLTSPSVVVPRARANATERLTTLIATNGQFRAAGHADGYWGGRWAGPQLVEHTLDADGALVSSNIPVDVSGSAWGVVSCFQLEPRLSNHHLLANSYTIDRITDRRSDSWEMAPFGSTPNCGTGTDSGSAVAIADKPIVLNEQDVFSQLIVHGVAEVRASQDRTFLELHVPLPFSSVATAQDAQNFLVAGVVANGGGPASQLQAIRLSPYAELVDTEPFTVNGSGNAKDRVQVAFNGTSYLIVWQQFRDPDWDIYAARVSPAGTVLDNPAVVVASAPEDELEPSVSSDGSAFLVTWTHRSGATADDIRARRVSGDGVVVDAQAFVVSAGASDESRAYSASLEARRWLVGYTADGRIRYRFLDASPDLGGPGTVCSQASACASGFCADGVCCNSACAGGSADCQACNVAGSLGTCSTRPSGSSCDDGRACTTSDVCSGTVCQGNQASCGVTAPVLVAPNGPGVGPRPTYRWNAVTNATHYTLWVNDPTGTRINTMYAAADVGCATGTACSIRPATALNAGSAKFWVQAQAGAIKSPWSAALSFTVATAVPAVPTLIAPSGTQNTATPTYRFSRIADATDYYLWVNDSRGTRIKQFVTPAQAGCTTTSACSVTPTIALNTGSAKFWVQARNELGLSAWGLGMAFTVSAVFAPPVLTSPSGTINTTTPAYVWSAVPGATAYDLWVDDSTGNRINTTYTASDAGCASAATCTLTPSVVLATGPAKWWVRARDTSRASAWSAVRNFSVAP